MQTGEPVPLSSDVKRMRTALLADELASRGHEVLWWASTFDHSSKSFVAGGDPVRKVGAAVEVRLLPALGYRTNISMGRYMDHWHVARKFRQALREEPPPPDLIAAATPDYHIAAAAAEYASTRGIPYVVDLRDPWPDSFVDPVPTRVGRALAKGILSADLSKVRRMLRGATGLVAMMDSMLDWGLAHAGRVRGPLDRVFYLGTEPLPEPDQSFMAMLRGKVGGNGRPVVVYVGTFGRYNHPGPIVDALRLLDEQGQDRGFDVIIGGGGELYHPIVERARGLDGVHFTGWLKAPQIAAVLALGSLGVVPWTEGAAFPNKAFAYFEAGLPILTSASGDLKRILLEEGVGSFWEPGRVEALAHGLMAMVADRERLRSMAYRVRALYGQRFTAARIYREYADHLELTLGARAG